MHTLGQMGKDLGGRDAGRGDPLLQALNDPVIEVRVAALETFGNLGTGSVAPAGHRARDANDEGTASRMLREAAENALTRPRARRKSVCRARRAEPGRRHLW